MSNTYIIHLVSGNSLMVDADSKTAAINEYVLRWSVVKGVMPQAIRRVELTERRPLSNLRVATELVISLLTGEGTTIDRYGDSPDEGYVVGVEGIKDPKTLDDIREWVTKLEGTPYYFGSWRDSETGSVFYDAVEIYEDLQDALRAATERGELAIWDLTHAKEIRTER